MAELRQKWQPRSAWTGVAQNGRFGRASSDVGVRLACLPHVPLATVIARSGGSDALAAAVRDTFALDLPPAGRAVFGAAADIVWSAPGQWLIVGRAQGTAADLTGPLRGMVAVSDQSDSRLLVRVSGPRARDVLAKGVAVDLHPSAFPVGSAAVTSVAHLGVQIWHADTDAFVLAAARTSAGSFWSWLLMASTEYGAEVSGAI